MPSIEYNDAEVLKSYIDRHADYYMSEFERRCVELGIRREKAEAAEAFGEPRAAVRNREVWTKYASRDVVLALAEGVGEYKRRIKERLMRQCAKGELSVNRCPKCHRIVRTPKAQQCLWCGHDWHGI